MAEESESESRVQAFQDGALEREEQPSHQLRPKWLLLQVLQ